MINNANENKEYSHCGLNVFATPEEDIVIHYYSLGIH